MIRINLIGIKTKPKPTATKTHVLVFVVLLVLEAGFLFLWYQLLSNELSEATKRTKDATTKIEELKKVKDAWEKWQAQKADLERQVSVFESLRADQTGPLSVVQFLSYALTKITDSPLHADEMKAQELAGWNPRWDTRRVWIRRYSEKERMLTLVGEAIDHEDVAEFYRRLESSDYFLQIEPGLQSRKIHSELGIKYVEFTVTMLLNYNVALGQSTVEGIEAAQPKVPAVTSPSAADSGPGVVAK